MTVNSAAYLETGVQLDAIIDQSLLVASDENATFAEDFYRIDGMSGKRFRKFLNHLIGAIPAASYLEVGLWGGATFCSAIAGNHVRALGIDDWSGMETKQGQIPAPKKEFFKNLTATRANGFSGWAVGILEQDFRAVDYSNLTPFDVYFYDGPHGRDHQREALTLALRAMKREFIYIVDDWNWLDVQMGTAEAVMRCGLSIVHDISIKTNSDGSYYPGMPLDPWHNGCWIAVLNKSIAPRDGRAGTLPTGSP